MSHYQHLSREEREKILVLRTEKKSLSIIATEKGRTKSTISRELKRNSTANRTYSAIGAQQAYQKRRKKSRRNKLLEEPGLKQTVKRLFLEEQWSPEQISNRLKYEKSAYQISYATIYRAIYAGMLDKEKLSNGNRGAIRKLRHRGKPRHGKGTVENRGKMAISNRIQERPKEADERKVMGHWEADTVAGRNGSACLVTITDRCSRYLLAGKIAKKRCGLLADKIIALLSPLPDGYVRTITPDRGKEFAKHRQISAALRGIAFYFADPHAPWQRGTNENTNGLLREYLPKSFDMAPCSDGQIASFVLKLNTRPRKCLGWKSPFEVFFRSSLHLT